MSTPLPVPPPPMPVLPVLPAAPAVGQPAYQAVPQVLSPQGGVAFAPGTNQTRPAVADGGFLHFLRFVLVWFLMALSCALVVGVVWMMVALSRTGRRKRDLLMFCIPVWGTVVQVQTLWRYSAKNVYWSVRADRPSKALFST